MINKIYILFFLIFIACDVNGIAQKAFFVNTKESGTHVFWSDWVKYMKVSKIDIDSVMCADFVTQEIWTCDTVVRLPLESIESITFHAPSTVYQSGVEKLEDRLWDYIKGYNEDQNIIFLDKAINEKSIPSPGTKLCTTQMTDIFPNGFVGEVKKVFTESEYVSVQCDRVEFTDIFKRYYSGYMESATELNDELGKPLKAPPFIGEKVLTIGPKKVDINLPPIDPSYKFNEEESLGFGIRDSYAGATLETNYKLRAYMIVDENSDVPVYCTFSGMGNHILTTRFDISGHISHKWEKSIVETPQIRGLIPLATLSFEVGPFVEFNFDTDLEMDTRHEFNSAFRIVYSANGAENEALPSQSPVFNLKSNEYNLNSLNFSGQMMLGGFLKAVVGIMGKNVAQGFLGLKGGLRLTADYTIPKEGIDVAYKTPDFYEKIKNNGGNISFVVVPDGGFSVFPNTKWEIGFPIEMNTLVDKELFKLQLLPTFSNIKSKRNHYPEKTADLSFDVSGLSPFTYNIGGTAISKYDDTLWPNSEISSESFSPTFDKRTYKFNLNLDSQFQKYTLAPIINIFGYNIMASPTDEIEEGIDVYTMDAKNIMASSASVYGKVYAPNDFRNRPIPLFYYTERDKNEWKSIQTYDWNTIDEFVEFGYSISGLKPETEYEYYFALKEYNNANSPEVKGEIKRFKTKKEDICHVGFDLVYPICQRGGMVYPKSDIYISGRYIDFRIATKPILEDVPEGMTMIGQGAILYKNGIEISRSKLGTLDSNEGHSIVSCILQDPDLTIDNKNYIAKADKAEYEAGMYFQFINKNGLIVEQRSDIRKLVNFVYDTKPYCYTSWAKYGKGCEDEPVYNSNNDIIGYVHHHWIYFSSIIRVGGTFWINGAGPTDSSNDLVFLPYNEAFLVDCPRFSVEYNSEDAPKKEYASFVDVNGITHRSNVIIIDYNAEGHPIDTKIDNNHTTEFLQYFNMELQWPWLLKDETWLNNAKEIKNLENSEYNIESKQRRPQINMQ